MGNKTKLVKVDASFSASRNRNEEFEIEVPEDATEAEIEKIVGDEVMEWAMNFCEIGYNIKEATNG
jgi:hypothetical protein